MSIELKIPNVGESIQEVQIGRWLKQQGDEVEADENVVELETDKASLELPAPAAGVIQEILKQEGESVSVGETIAYLEEAAAEEVPKRKENRKKKKEKEKKRRQRDQAEEKKGPERDEDEKETVVETIPVTPSGRRALLEYGLRPEDIRPAGSRISREDVLRTVEQQKERGGDGKAPPTEAPRKTEEERAKVPPREATADEEKLEEVVPMSLIRRRIAQRLVEAQQQAALLTTFNEIDMSAVIKLRKSLGERFRNRYGVKLGFMSFFVKATIDALKDFPQLNAEVRGTDIVYRNYFHVGIAIGSERGLVVPVLRHAERMSFAGIEQTIGDFSTRAGANKLRPEELAGGTFTISNGGIYGSLLSTPIVNPPQSGVLGMHTIEERPVARNGQVVIRPMMYVALTYDHRIVDGREAVSCLRRVKEAIEEPSRMLIEV